MEDKTTMEDKIRVMQVKIQVEKDPERKQELNKQLRVLQLNKQIEDIRKRIQQLR